MRVDVARPQALTLAVVVRMPDSDFTGLSVSAFLLHGIILEVSN